MVAPAHAGSMDLAPQLLEFVGQAVACAASVSLVTAGRGEAVRHVLNGTRCGVSLPVGYHESAVQLGVFCLPDPACGTSAPRENGPHRNVKTTSARPAGFEPATRCLEGTAGGSRDVA